MSFRSWVAAGFSWAVFLLLIPPTALSVSSVTDKAATKIVGDSQGWRFGVNYSSWALSSAPFYINDKLVFRYEPPSRSAFVHNVYLMKNRTNFNSCSFDQAKLVASETQGGGSGFQFILRKRTKNKPYYFACSVHNGTHCGVGLMKFAVLPLCRP